MKTLLTITLLVSLFSCSRKKLSVKQNRHFVIREYKLKNDTTINSIGYLKNYILCLQDDGKIIVLDSSYERQRAIEQKLNILKTDNLLLLNDSIFLQSRSQVYFLDSNFNRKKLDIRNRRFRDYIFEDSNYCIYECCMGEFGGSVFFLEKKTSKVFSYFATCATQAFPIDKGYLVCNNLAHMSGSMSFCRIKNPSELYKLPDSLKDFCNWYLTVDSLKNYDQRKPLKTVKCYDSSYTSMSLMSFSFNDTIYSILCSDTSTSLAYHSNDSLVRIQAVFNKSIIFHQTKFIYPPNKTIGLFNLALGSPFAAYIKTGNSSGLVIQNNNYIDFVF